MTIPDLRHEAAVLRAALALGLVVEEPVTRWATERLEVLESFHAELTDVALVAQELTAQREALRALAERADQAVVGLAIRHMMVRALRVEGRPVAAMLRVAHDARVDGLLPPAVATEVKLLEDRASLAAVGMPGVEAPSAGELDAVFCADLAPACYTLSFGSADEAAAFVAALSRKVHRDRRGEGFEASVWCDALPAARGPVHVMLDEGALDIAAREFGPLPASANIPYPRLDAATAMLVDSETAASIGLDEARALLHAH
jgi:hypothetical protein